MLGEREESGRRERGEGRAQCYQSPWRTRGPSPIKSEAPGGSTRQGNNGREVSFRRSARRAMIRGQRDNSICSPFRKVLSDSRTTRMTGSIHVDSPLAVPGGLALDARPGRGIPSSTAPPPSAPTASAPRKRGRERLVARDIGDSWTREDVRRDGQNPSFSVPNAALKEHIEARSHDGELAPAGLTAALGHIEATKSRSVHG